MNFEKVAEFLGWCTVINIWFLSLSAVLIVVFKSRIVSFHRRVFDIPESKLNTLYFSYLSHYKLFTVVFFLVPYLALKIIS